MSKIRGCAFALFVTSFFHAAVFLVRGLVQLVAWVLYFFGLWAPAVYALFGLFLHIFLRFDPFAYDALSVAYLAGFGLSVLLAAFLAFRNLVGNPIQNTLSSLKRFTSATASEEKPAPIPQKRRRSTPAAARPAAVASSAAAPSPEAPDVYWSAVEPQTLIHEYRDRFEVYRMNDGKRTLKKVEYKDAED